MSAADKTTFRCGNCGWTGTEPSMSDASYVRKDYAGNLIHDRVHVPVCVQCFHAVRREAASKRFAA